MIKIQIKKIQQMESKCGLIRTIHGLVRTGHGQLRQIIQYYYGDIVRRHIRRHISEINLADLSEKPVLSLK